jgi:hypothetical protein
VPFIAIDESIPSPTLALRKVSKMPNAEIVRVGAGRTCPFAP